MRLPTLTWLLVVGLLHTPPTVAEVAAETPESQQQPVDSVVVALRAQLAEMRNAHGDLLATTHWALALAGGVAFLLVGYSWFNNNRNYERDKAAMATSLRNELGREILSVREEVYASAAVQREELTKLATTAADKSASALSSKVESLGYLLSELEEELIEIQIERAEEKRHGWAALAGRLKLLAKRTNESWDMRIADELEGLSKLLKQPWFRMDADDASGVMAAMDRVGSMHAADADAIRARVRELRGNNPA
jgi:hypothetical protein